MGGLGDGQLPILLRGLALAMVENTGRSKSGPSTSDNESPNKPQ